MTKGDGIDEWLLGDRHEEIDSLIMRFRQSLASLCGECNFLTLGTWLFLYEIATTSPLRTGLRELVMLLSVFNVELRVGLWCREGMMLKGAQEEGGMQ